MLEQCALRGSVRYILLTKANWHTECAQFSYMNNNTSIDTANTSWIDIDHAFNFEKYSNYLCYIICNREYSN